ncbi:DUF2163 domain-containing protein [Rickettsiales endosymbiont of Paramecium tredecaurelia]|uniref:phage BR0599 family protein n=1 Tax=Candidatus Sarmatiella mevalonica TaxID=2770581 RepID=UPI00192478AE|nr:phage BR0599 family protein [Candidatus Sarmatiella mevalonica]MBL3284403.1 DUF2163 domain-containing protein [Candidatus Sarmatiella mevalonica]
MTRMPDVAILALQNGYIPYYCFRITLSSKQTLYLTSAKHDVQKDGVVFSSADLNIIKGEFDDDYNNYLIIESIDYLLQQDRYNFQDAVFAIDVYWDEYKYFFGNYICTHCEKLDFRLQLKLESEMFKYRNLVLDCYSKNCRAKLGDELCGIDIHKFSTMYRISYIEGRKIKLLDTILLKSFVKGLCWIKEVDIVWSAKIIYHTEVELKLDQPIPKNLDGAKACHLTPYCNKTLEMCATFFQNCKNFQGEPF